MALKYGSESARRNHEPDHSVEERRANSAALIRQPFKPGDPEYGKVFLLGKPGMDSVKKGMQNITIREETPTAVLDAATRDALGLPASHPTVADIQAGKGPEGFKLITAGANLIVKNTRTGEERTALITQEDGTLTGPTAAAGGRLGNSGIDALNNQLAVLQRARGGVAELLTFDDMYDQDTTKAQKQAQFAAVKAQITDSAPLWARRPSKGDKVREVDAFPHQDTLNLRQSVEILVGSPDKIEPGKPLPDAPLFARFPTDMRVDDAPNTISLRENIALKVSDFSDILVVDPTGKKPVGLYTPEQALAGKPSPDIARLAQEQITAQITAQIRAGRVDAGPAGTKVSPTPKPTPAPGLNTPALGRGP